VFKGFGVVALVLVLAACGALKARHATPQHPAESISSPGLPSSGRVYHIDATRSELRVLVYRAGPLARLGHNHVIVNRALRGEVNLADAAGASTFSLNVPAADFVVDDAQARREEGGDFAAEIPDDAKAGTLQNMLGTALLDAAEFAVITINSVDVSGPQSMSDADSMIATVAISVAGHESKIDVPFKLQSDSNTLSATGLLELRQSALGLTPYSLMLGALQVQDAMKIKFKIVAVPS
jgi:hypothetical protein